MKEINTNTDKKKDKGKKFNFLLNFLVSFK
jgi:hypothetical protein